VILDIAMKDPNVDYWMMGEGERSFPGLLDELEKPKPDLSVVDGLAYWCDDAPIVVPSQDFIEDLDSVPLPDYGNLNLLDYGNRELKYAAGLLPRQFPYAVTIASRGCPYRCIFCAASTVSGRKIRFRSASHVLEEIDSLYEAGIREIIFLDDHFLGNRKRAIELMQGLLDRKYDLTWKCANLAIHHLDREILAMMKASGSYQMTLSIESGCQDVLDHIVKKPINLAKVPEIIKMARVLGFEIIANFVIGFPGETWEQIRETCRFAERMDVDIVNFHVATPLPKTELMEICLRDGCLPEGYDIEQAALAGYAQGLISTDEFTPFELEILRAFEWDRINFGTEKRQMAIARIEGVSLQEIKTWRMTTRRRRGISVVS
jgi:radical SAM superfamily enzyme YgiQ (UPF0313 family)